MQAKILPPDKEWYSTAVSSGNDILIEVLFHKTAMTRAHAKLATDPILAIRLISSLLWTIRLVWWNNKILLVHEHIKSFHIKIILAKGSLRVKWWHVITGNRFFIIITNNRTMFSRPLGCDHVMETIFFSHVMNTRY